MRFTQRLPGYNQCILSRAMERYAGELALCEHLERCLEYELGKVYFGSKRTYDIKDWKNYCRRTGNAERVLEEG